jgi:DNA-binding NarL/FixJ family response regulator
MAIAAPDRIRILLLDDHILFAQGVGRLLSLEPDLVVASHCTTAAQAHEVTMVQPIDLVLLDLDLGNSRGDELLLRLAPASVRPKVLILTAGVTESEVASLFERGASGICFKDQPVETLARAIRSVMAGEAWIDQRCLSALARGKRAGLAPARGFTERVRQVMRGVFDGLANKEIGARLQVSESTVKATLQQLFEKTGVRTRSQLVRIVLERHRELV